ncbi:SWIM zinc finger family protein [Nocardioides sp.]|uniref:SWIM zinc finger family protein n=1 Tax=Nocardioides sp. TaxID=35761 RepID=UPI0025F16ED4|nr:SWIM zinc finger family protein [Nocardioides sp.]
MWIDLTDLADEGSLIRGEDYARQGRVHVTRTAAGRVDAQVHGTTTYDVVLHARDWSCTCPVGISGDFCKHLVATALVASGETGGPPDGPASLDEAAGRGIEGVATWLGAMDDRGLREVLSDLAREHPDAMDALVLAHGRATGDVSALLPLVQSLRTRRHLDWRAADDHGREAHEVADELERALTPATAASLVPLLETAIADLVRVIGRSDDSSGIQGDAASRLLALHTRAATLAPPDPGRLARWLIKNTFDDAMFLELDVVRYAPALGERGLEIYRRELDKRLEAAPGSSGGQEARRRLAVLDGDIDTIVELVGRGLSSVFHYDALVAALLEAGHEDAALQYALEGTRAGTSWQKTPRLYDVAAQLLRARGRTEEALALRRRQLADLPTTSSYASLREEAESAETWETERLTALDMLLERAPRAWINVLLDEGETELAWEAARDLALDTPTLVRLVRARARTHPEDVFDAYVALIEEHLRVADQRNYRQAVAYLQELGRAAALAHQADRYVSLVADLVETHRRRPTLVTMLERLAGRGPGH